MRTVGVRRIGHSYRPSLARASASDDHGVLVVDHGTMARPPASGQAHPGHPLLGGLDEIETKVLVHCVAEPADLSDAFGASLEQLRVGVDEPAGAVPAARLLIREEREDDVARRTAALTQSVAHHGQGHRVHVLHVDRPATPDAAVLHLTGERMNSPVVGVGGHDVEVPVDEERRPGSCPHPQSEPRRSPVPAPTRAASARCPPPTAWWRRIRRPVVPA